MSKYLDLWDNRELSCRECAIKGALIDRNYNTVIPEDQKRIDDTMDYLISPYLLKNLIKESQTRVAGEEATIENLHVWFAGRLVKNPQQLASYNLLVNSESGAGKDHVTKAVLKDYPSSCRVERTKITPEVLTYWHNARTEPNWTWNGKIFYLEDVTTSILNSPVFKVMASGGSKATIVNKQLQAEDIEVRGKPVMVVTTATATPNKELGRRFPITSLDETHDQTKAIIERQAKSAADGIIPEPDNLICEAISLLHRVRVKVVIAELIVPYFPYKHIGIRTHFPRFIDLIKASAALHQFQRERDEEGYVLSTWEDYDIARRCLLRTVSNHNLISVTRNQRRILSIFGEEKGIIWWTVDLLLPKVTFISDRQLRRELNKLVENGFLIAQLGESAGSGRRPLEYSKAETYDLLLPTSIEIMSEMASKSSMSIMSEMSITRKDEDNEKESISDKNDVFAMKKPTSINVITEDIYDS